MGKCLVLLCFVDARGRPAHEYQQKWRRSGFGDKNTGGMGENNWEKKREEKMWPVIFGRLWGLQVASR